MHSFPVVPQYLVEFRPGASLRRELAALVDGLDCSAITTPSRAVIEVDELLMGIEIQLERALDAAGEGLILRRRSRTPGDEAGRDVVVTSLRGDPVPPGVLARVEEAYAQSHGKLVTMLRAHRASLGLAGP